MTNDLFTQGCILTILGVIVEGACCVLDGHRADQGFTMILIYTSDIPIICTYYLHKYFHHFSELASCLSIWVVI